MSSFAVHSTPLNWTRSLMKKSRADLVLEIKRLHRMIDEKEAIINRLKAAQTSANPTPCNVINWGPDLRCQTHNTVWGIDEEPPCQPKETHPS